MALENGVRNLKTQNELVSVTFEANQMSCVALEACQLVSVTFEAIQMSCVALEACQFKPDSLTDTSSNQTWTTQLKPDSLTQIKPDSGFLAWSPQISGSFNPMKKILNFVQKVERNCVEMINSVT